MTTKINYSLNVSGHRGKIQVFLIETFIEKVFLLENFKKTYTEGLFYQTCALCTDNFMAGN